MNLEAHSDTALSSVYKIIGVSTCIYVLWQYTDKTSPSTIMSTKQSLPENILIRIFINTLLHRTGIKILKKLIYFLPERIDHSGVNNVCKYQSVNGFSEFPQ